MGVHTGVAEVRDGDYYGGVLNRAARLMAIAHGDQIVVSLTTVELVRDDDYEFLDLGEHRLRDLGRPEHVFQVAHPDLAREFDALKSLDVVHRRICRCRRPRSWAGRASSKTCWRHSSRIASSR